MLIYACSQAEKRPKMHRRHAILPDLGQALAFVITAEVRAMKIVIVIDSFVYISRAVGLAAKPPRLKPQLSK
jgi:hypothetical protein